MTQKLQVVNLSVVYRRPKVFGRSRRFLTFGFAFGCRRSMQPKAEGLAEGWNFWNSVNLSANFVTKILEWSKCMFVQCSKRFENLYYIISIRAFQKPMSEYAHRILKYKIPNLRLHLRLRLRGPKFFHLRLRLRLRPKKSPSVDRGSRVSRPARWPNGQTQRARYTQRRANPKEILILGW